MAAGALAFLLAAAALAPQPSASAARIVGHGPPPPRVSKVDGSAVSSVTFRRPASTGRYWTRERLLLARPADNPPPPASFDLPWPGGGATASAATGDFTPRDLTAYPHRIQGKIFFRLGSAAYSCSGTVVESAKRNVVFTAGHCVFDPTEHRYVDDLVFIPGYENGKGSFEAPLDVIAATYGKVPEGWINSRSNSYDIGVVGLSQPVQRTLGGRQIAFDLNPSPPGRKARQYTIFGYPSEPSELFDGEVLRGCRVAFRGFDNSPGNKAPFPMSAGPCKMEQGASGGGWITRGNYLNSVVSYGYCDKLPRFCGYLFGPRFSNAAKALYVAAGGSPRPTIGLVKAPPRVVHKRAVRFRFKGSAATLLRFVCRLDRQRKKACAQKVLIRGLRPGRHTLRAWTVDQTGRVSRQRLIRHFRVVLPRR